MSEQHYLNKLQTTNKLGYKLYLPAHITSQPTDIESIEQRDWVVPGEKALVLIEVSNSLSSFDTFNFYCIVSDSEHSSLSKKGDNILTATSLSLTPQSDTITNFKTKDGKMIFPIRIHVPISRASNLYISAFCLRGERQVALLECHSLQPFIVSWNRFITPQSIIIQFTVQCNLINGWNQEIPISQANLKFDESHPEEYKYTQSIAILRTAENNYKLKNGDQLSLAFSLKPLSNEGAIRLAEMPLILSLEWKAPLNDGEFLQYLSTFPFKVGNDKSDLVISAPLINAELLKPSLMPLRITNMRDDSRKIKICFGTGKIQPMSKSYLIEFEPNESKTIDFGFIPLCAGEHKIKLWVDEDEKIIKPMFPICLSVKKSE